MIDDKWDINCASDLDTNIRKMIAMERIERGEYIGGTLHVDYVTEATRRIELISELETRGVKLVWRKKHGVCKGYFVCSYRSHTEIEGRWKIDYRFHQDPARAYMYDTWLFADRERITLDTAGVEIDASWGGKFHCRDFEIQEILPEHFVIYCEAPFIPITGSFQSTPTPI